MKNVFAGIFSLQNSLGREFALSGWREKSNERAVGITCIGHSVGNKKKTPRLA
jgi:hypothetical protein